VERTLASEIGQHVGQRITIAGWVHRVRRLSKVSFLIVRDRSGFAQVVLDEAAASRLDEVFAESVVRIVGVVVANEQAPGGFEMHEPTIEVLSAAIEPPPFDLFRPVLKPQLPTQLDHAALSLRHARRRALWQLAAASMAGFRQTLSQRGFTEIHTPKIVGTATEGGANVFAVDYMGTPAYLAQSPQFYKQIMVGVFERVYEVGPVFRAEPHDTTRHLNEYVSLDVEMGFIDDHTTVMETLTEVLRGMVDALAEDASRAVESLRLTLPTIPEIIPVVHFSAALEMVGETTGEDLRTEPDLAPAHERWLGEWAMREHGSEFLFVVGYPMRKRPFYTHPDPARPAYSNSFDLLFRGLELVTGGQRLHRYGDYVAALAARGQSPEPLAGYLEAFRYGMPPHGGFAIGLERWVAQIAGAPNLREVALFPRDLHRVSP
jgi:nondiscriminating aspartyl-tRNA synthetase